MFPVYFIAIVISFLSIVVDIFISSFLNALCSTINPSGNLQLTTSKFLINCLKNDCNLITFFKSNFLNFSIFLPIY